MKLNRTFVKWLAPVAAFGLLIACDPVTVDPAETSARFNVTQSETDFLTYSFENVSIGDNNTYAWDFGDGNTSTDESPSHTYAAAGEYTVSLTATGDGGADTRTETVTVVDPQAEQKKLAGETSKVWKLIREGNALVVGPNDGSGSTWWTFGSEGATKNYERACKMNDEWTFDLAAGTVNYNSNGDVYADGGDFGPWTTESCYDITDPNAFAGKEGDLSAWGDGTHDFAYDAAAGTLTLSGNGAWIGLPKVGTDAEVSLPQDEVIYQVTKLVDVENGVDTLQLRIDYNGGTAFWQFTLVSYDDPADEPELPEPPSNDKNVEANDIFDNFANDANTNITWKTTEVTGWTPGTANPDAGETFLTGQYDKGTLSPYENLQAELDHIMDLSTRNVFTMRAYFPSSNDYATEDPNAESWADPKSLAQTVSVKLQNSLLGGNAFSTQVEVKHTIATENLDSWVDLTFDFSGAADRDDLDQIVIQLGGEGQSRTGTFYLADFKLNQ